MATTFRSDLVAGVLSVLTAQKAATPTLLRAVYPARPGSFSETPCAYIGARDETITHGGGSAGYGLRTRTFTGLSVVIVDALPDPTQTIDRLDDLVDALVDRFTAAYAVVAGGSSILEMTGVSDTDVEVAGVNGPIVYRGCVLTFGRTFISEGRT